jgi:hypothetical protein
VHTLQCGIDGGADSSSLTTVTGMSAAQGTRRSTPAALGVSDALEPGHNRPQLADQEIPGPPPLASGPRFPVPAESGIGDSLFPPRFPIPANRESGSPPFPKKPGNRGNRESDFLSDEHQLQWTRNILSREYHASAFTGSMRLLFRLRDSEREHAAVSDEHQLQWTPHSLSREFHALTGSMRLLFRVRETEHAAVICLKRLRKVTSRS